MAEAERLRQSLPADVGQGDLLKDELAAQDDDNGQVVATGDISPMSSPLANMTPPGRPY
jgi:hypothetical protein